jgi:bifunctional oligoribonuclease and PAP phosphatase NrnA
MTDTGQFRFNSTSQRCFVLAGELVARGASPGRGGLRALRAGVAGKLRLLQRASSRRFEMECGGRVCIGTLAPGVFEATGTTAEDTEGLVDFARCVDGVDIGVLIEERPDGGVKASLRAKDPSAASTSSPGSSAAAATPAPPA